MAIIDTIDYLGTVYEIADTKTRNDISNIEDAITGTGTFNPGDSSCIVAMNLSSTDNYIIQIGSTVPLTVLSVSHTSTQVTVNINKQSSAGEICVVARKVS